MHVILYMAISLNGMIARPNNDTDFLAHDNWTLFVELAQQVGAMVWGRKTHEEVRRYGPQFLEDLRAVKGVVVSRSPTLALEAGWEHALSPSEALEKLEAQQIDQVVLVGGAALNTAFAREGRIDAVIINIESVVIGSGIPLFLPAVFDLRLQVREVKRAREEIIQIHYQVKP